MIRVGHLIKGLGRGGAETLLPHLARAMAADVETHVGYFLPWKDALVADLRSAGAPVTCFGARSSVQMFLRRRAVRRWAQEHALDLVHCHLPMAGVVGRLALRGSAIPVVYTEHNLQERYRAGTRWLNRATWRMQHQVIAVSEEVARSIARHLPGDVPVRVVSNGIPDIAVPDAAGRAQLRRSLGLEGVPVVGTVAVFRAQKRLDLWLRVARGVADRIPAARFLLVGDGPMRATIERQIAAEGLVDRVVMPGMQSGIGPWLACMDVFLITSEFEGLPLALLEAMMSATPVVATRVGGVPEAVEDGRTGFLENYADTDRQVQRVVQLLGDEAARQQMGAAARRRALESFGVARMAGELLAVYRAVLSHESGAGGGVS